MLNSSQFVRTKRLKRQSKCRNRWG